MLHTDACDKSHSADWGLRSHRGDSVTHPGHCDGSPWSGHLDEYLKKLMNKFIS